MSSFLAIQVRLHDGRFHGAGDWPPSPARLFQALVAGAGLGRVISDAEADSFKWLESLPPPEILAPQARETRGFTTYVPNNDLDAKKGDPRNISAIRTGKNIRARLFDADLPFCYVWVLPEEPNADFKARAVLDIASRLYQFGRGVDMAWATGDIVGEDGISELRSRAGLDGFTPGSGATGTLLQVPCEGSYRSLELRYLAGGIRFSIVKSGKANAKVLAQAPKARFRTVAYNCAPAIHVFDLRLETEDSPFLSAPLDSVASLTPAIRDAAAERLLSVHAADPALIEQVMIGKNSDGSHVRTKTARIRIVPLPSIGHQHADMAVRRVAVSIPPGCSLPTEDILWAFSSLKLALRDQPFVLLPSIESDMLRYYVAPAGARVWRSITPVALPDSAGRRRINPKHITVEAKQASEKAAEELRAEAAVIQALRHAGLEKIEGKVMRLSRAPLHLSGAKADQFAEGSRFAKERLWHVELQFSKKIEGPLIIGDGRFFGLGLFVPVES